MNILLIGDIVGQPGCEFFEKNILPFKKYNNIDLVIVNGENSAVGNGILPKTAQMLLNVGADAITLGNHALTRREIYDYLDNEQNPIIRPANFDITAPGRGSMIIDMGKTKVGIINLIGSVYMPPCENPFRCADEEVLEMKNQGANIIIVDFHAEATAEKRALGYYLAEKVSAVVGTHTHVQTSDEQILDGGTAYITDLGMTGPADSVLGVEKELAIQKIKTNLPVRFANPQTDKCVMEGVIITADEKTGTANHIERIRLV